MDSSPKKNVIDFSENNSFDELVIIESKNSPILVNFFAQWYTPCIRIKPKLEEISNNNNIKLINIEVDENQELSNRYNVSEIPHVFLFHNAYSVMDFCGRDKKKILDKMCEYIQQKTNKFIGHRQSLTDKNIISKPIKRLGNIPEEPPEGENVFELAFKYNNEIFTRRFLDSNTIGQIKEFVKSKTNAANIIIFTPFPRKVYNDNRKRLKDAGLSKREMLNVELI
jgi:thioredoxin-like negative regulator of GroEL